MAIWSWENPGFKYVVRDSFNRADTVASTAGAVVLAVVAHIIGVEGSKMLSADLFIRSVQIAVSGFIAIWATIMFCRACWWPLHRRLVPHGGLLSFLRVRLGGNMWPVILMLSGIACFALFFGAGVVMFAMNQTMAREMPATCKASNSEYNLTKKLQAIDEIYAQLAGPMSDLQNEAGMLLNTFNSRVVNSTAIPDLLTYHDHARAVFQKFGQTFMSYDYLGDIYSVMIHDSSNFAYSWTEDASINLAHELQRLHSQTPDDVLQNVQNSRQMSVWESAVSGTATWIGRKQDALRQKRREIEATDICSPS
jgi:hypothetical protein